jgi:hypothetical protein
MEIIDVEPSIEEEKPSSHPPNQPPQPQSSQGATGTGLIKKKITTHSKPVRVVQSEQAVAADPYDVDSWKAVINYAQVTTTKKITYIFYFFSPFIIFQ